MNDRDSARHFERLSPIGESPRASVTVTQSTVGLPRTSLAKQNSCRMYESLHKLREYHFRLQLYTKTKKQVFKESLLPFVEKDDLSELSTEASIAEMLRPTFQRFLDTRDITNYLLKTQSVKPLMISSEETEMMNANMSMVVDQNRFTMPLQASMDMSILHQSSMRMSMAVDHPSEPEKSQELSSLLSMEPLMATKNNNQSIPLFGAARHTTNRKSQVIIDDLIKMETARPKVHVWRPELFSNINACDPDFTRDSVPQEALPKLLKAVAKSPLLGALVFEAVVDKNKGLPPGEYLEDEHSNLLLNISQMYYSNLVEEYRADSPFLQAFAYFIERLPPNTFAYRNGRREIVNEEVRQVIKILFEGQTRRAPAIQYLRMLYQKLVKKINCEKILPLFRLNKKQGEELKVDDPQSLVMQQTQEQLGRDSGYSEDSRSSVRTSQSLSEVCPVPPPINKVKSPEAAKKKKSGGFFGLFKRNKNEDKNDKAGGRLSEIHPSQSQVTGAKANKPEPRMSNGFENLFDEDPRTRSATDRSMRQTTKVGVGKENGHLSPADKEVKMVQSCSILLARLFMSPGLADLEIQQVLAKESSINQNELLQSFLYRKQDRDNLLKQVRLGMKCEQSAVSQLLINIQQEWSDKSRRYQPREKKKDVSHYMIWIVKKLMGMLQQTQDQIPFTIRAMLNIVQLKARKSTANQPQLREKDKLPATACQADSFILTELLWGCWLSTGLRTPELFGLLPYIQHDHVFFLSLFSGCRLLVEQLFTFQTLPEDNAQVNAYFDLKRINSYIIFETLTPTLNFYTQLLDVSTHELQPTLSIKSHQAAKQKTMVAGKLNESTRMATEAETGRRASTKTTTTEQSASDQTDGLFARCARVTDLFTLLKLCTFVHNKYVVERANARMVADFRNELNEECISSSEGQSTTPTAGSRESGGSARNDNLVATGKLQAMQLRQRQNRLSLITPRQSEVKADSLTVPGRPSDDQAEVEVKQISDLVAPLPIQAMLREFSALEYADDFYAKYQLNSAEKSERQCEEYVLFVDDPSYLTGPVIANQTQIYVKFHKAARSTELKNLQRIQAQLESTQQTEKVKQCKEKIQQAREWFDLMKSKQRHIQRFLFYLMRLLGAVSVPELRILELGSDAGTYKSIEGVVKRLRELHADERSVTVEVMGRQVLRELKEISIEAASTTSQVKVLDFLQRLTRDEIFRRNKAVCEVAVEAELLKENLKNCHSLFSEQQNFFGAIYKDIKLSLFLSETDPNVCLLFNDGANEKDAARVKAIPRDQLGFFLHTACKTHLQDIPFSGFMLFQEYQMVGTEVEQPDEVQDQATEEAKTATSKRKTRVKQIECLKGSRHYPIKFIEFFILAIENKFLPQFKRLVRDDHHRREDDDYVDGDYMNFVDTYAYFIEEIGNLARTMAEKAIINGRFTGRDELASHVTIGVHNYIMRQLYRNVFERMSPSDRDKEVNRVFTENADFLMNQAAKNLKDLLRLDETQFKRLVALSEQSSEIMEHLAENAHPNEIEDAMNDAVWCFGRHAEFAKSGKLPFLLEIELRRVALDYFLARALTRAVPQGWTSQMMSRSRIFSQLKFTQLFYYPFQLSATHADEGDGSQGQQLLCSFAIDKLKKRSSGELLDLCTEEQQRKEREDEEEMRRTTVISKDLKDDDMEFELV